MWYKILDHMAGVPNTLLQHGGGILWPPAGEGAYILDAEISKPLPPQAVNSEPFLSSGRY